MPQLTKTARICLWYNVLMKNVIRSTTQTAQLFMSQYMRPGETAIDATCGNGHDTLALAKMGAGNIYGFDIQESAIRNTTELLIKEGFYSEKIHLIRDGHENMRDHINEKARVIVFNLGYLPSAAKEITTRKETTLAAVKAALTLLKKDGLLCITMYSGHPGGQEEKQAVLDFAASLDERRYHAAYINLYNQRNHPPEILLITSKRGVEIEKD